MRQAELYRMLHWLAIAFALYALALLTTQPQLQTGLWKLGHITIGAFAGYWVDRNLYGRVTAGSTEGRLKSRAMVVAAAVLGMALGL